MKKRFLFIAGSMLVLSACASGPRYRTPKADEPEPSPTISNNTSSGPVDRPVRRASGTLTVQEALRLALKEHGLS